jgi:formamidopyrimidine-DNA glycosylase
MPELPFVTVLVENLRPWVEGRTVEDVIVKNVYPLKTADPPITALRGRRVAAVRRRGKLIILDVEGPLRLVVHLRRNGRLEVRPAGAGRTARDLALTFVLNGGRDLRLIETGPKKAASVWLLPVREPDAAAPEGAPGGAPGPEAAGPLAGLGVEPLSSEFTVEVLTRQLREARMHLKRFLTQQRYVVGIGNAFSDEILWEARLSPQALTASLRGAEIARLHAAVVKVLDEAVASHRRAFAGALPMREPVELLRVHRHGKEPCPRCGTPLAVIYYDDRETYYCPACQAGGKVYADRRRSRLFR